MNESIPFMQPRMVGERFQGHAIPLEMLRALDVAARLDAFRDLNLRW